MIRRIRFFAALTLLFGAGCTAEGFLRFSGGGTATRGNDGVGGASGGNDGQQTVEDVAGEDSIGRPAPLPEAGEFSARARNDTDRPVLVTMQFIYNDRVVHAAVRRVAPGVTTGLIGPELAQTLVAVARDFRGKIFPIETFRFGFEVDEDEPALYVVRDEPVGGNGNDNISPAGNENDNIADNDNQNANQNDNQNVNDNAGGGGGQPSITDCNRNGIDDQAELCRSTQARGLRLTERFPTAARGDADALRGAYRVLWWDSTPDYSGSSADALRQEMSDYLTTFNNGAVFTSTYVGNETPGTLATHLAQNSYDVIVFDATSQNPKFNDLDLAAVRTHYATHSNVLLDGILYIRRIIYNSTTDFPGINGSTGGFTVNEVYQLANRGGGIMIGTDHEGYQVDANQVLQAIIPQARFSGITTPSVDGQFNGDDLLTALTVVSPFDLLQHWDAVPTEAIAPTGVFMDTFQNAVTLYSQVDVADDPGGGTKYPYISTSWRPSGAVAQFDCNSNGILDNQDIAGGTSQDTDKNGIPDECESCADDCNLNGVLDECELASGAAADCNENKTLDECDIARGSSEDCQPNGVPDECDVGFVFELLASNRDRFDNFGEAVAISGDTIVVGASREGDGAAYVFVRDGLSWAEQDKLTRPDRAVGDSVEFGIAVAIDGDTIVVGAPGQSGGGAAYVFVRTGSTWTDQDELLSSNGSPGDEFGRAVDIDGDTIIVGARGDDDDTGSAYVFVRSGTIWTEQDHLIADDRHPSDEFGRAVTIEGDTAAIGARGDDKATGAVYIFTRSGADWSQRTKLLASDGDLGDAFGRAVALSGDTLVVGADEADGGDGAAYVFVGGGSTWIEQQILANPSGEQGAEFGFAVAIDGDAIVVGAPHARFDSGLAFGFVRFGPVWTHLVTLAATDGKAGDLFGHSVGLSGLTAVVGARKHDHNVSDAGAAYVFTAPNSTDCNANGTPDECEDDCDGNGIPDECDLAISSGSDCNGDGTLDECQPDCDHSGTPDVCEEFPDCNTDGTPDDCQLVENDCNSDGTPDDCQLVENDCNSNGIPDDCEGEPCNRSVRQAAWKSDALLAREGRMDRRSIRGQHERFLSLR